MPVDREAIERRINRKMKCRWTTKKQKRRKSIVPWMIVISAFAILVILGYSSDRIGKALPGLGPAIEFLVKMFFAYLEFWLAKGMAGQQIEINWWVWVQWIGGAGIAALVLAALLTSDIGTKNFQEIFFVSFVVMILGVIQGLSLPEKERFENASGLDREISSDGM